MSVAGGQVLELFLQLSYLPIDRCQVIRRRASHSIVNIGRKLSRRLFGDEDDFTEDIVILVFVIPDRHLNLTGNPNIDFGKDIVMIRPALLVERREHRERSQDYTVGPLDRQARLKAGNVEISVGLKLVDLVRCRKYRLRIKLPDSPLVIKIYPQATSLHLVHLVIADGVQAQNRITPLRYPAEMQITDFKRVINAVTPILTRNVVCAVKRAAWYRFVKSCFKQLVCRKRPHRIGRFFGIADFPGLAAFVPFINVQTDT